jgi:hypothetical protein
MKQFAIPLSQQAGTWLVMPFVHMFALFSAATNFFLPLNANPSSYL